jgi:aspartate carbamoyltransferase catalytic subunit
VKEKGQKWRQKKKRSKKKTKTTNLKNTQKEAENACAKNKKKRTCFFNTSTRTNKDKQQ